MLYKLYFLYFQRRNQRPTSDMRVVANKIPRASNKTEEFTARYFARRELKLLSLAQENRMERCCIRGQGACSWYFTSRASKIPPAAANPRKYRNEVPRRLWPRETIRFAENEYANRKVFDYDWAEYWREIKKRVAYFAKDRKMPRIYRRFAAIFHKVYCSSHPEKKCLDSKKSILRKQDCKIYTPTII